MKTFIIFGLARTGSTLLGNLLNNQPTINCDGELLNASHWPTWQRPVLATLQRHPKLYLNVRIGIVHLVRRSRIYGFKLKFEQVVHPDRVLPDFYRTGWRILYLRRDSAFDAVISALVARQTQRWHTRTGSQEPDIEPIVIAPERFLERCVAWQKHTEQCDAIVNNLPHLLLIYEDDLRSSQQWHSTVARVCEYVGAALPTAVTSTLVKTWGRPYHDLISNYDELLEAFQGWEKNG
jgi:LPS sulfotransferase NodH